MFPLWSLCLYTVATCPAPGRLAIQVAQPHAWPYSLPSPNPDSLGFCAQTQRTPLTAGPGRVSLPAAWSAGWHDQPNLQAPSRRPLDPSLPARPPVQTQSQQQGTGGTGEANTPPLGLQGSSKLPQKTPLYADGCTACCSAWVVWQLPHYLLSFLREAKGRDQPGSSQRSRVGRAASVQNCPDPPSPSSGKASLGPPPLSSAQLRPSPQGERKDPGRGGRKGACPQADLTGQGKALVPKPQDECPARAPSGDGNLTLGYPGRPATKRQGWGGSWLSVVRNPGPRGLAAQESGTHRGSARWWPGWGEELAAPLWDTPAQLPGNPLPSRGVSTCLLFPPPAWLPQYIHCALPGSEDRRPGGGTHVLKDQELARQLCQPEASQPSLGAVPRDRRRNGAVVTPPPGQTPSAISALAGKQPLEQALSLSTLAVSAEGC